MKFAKLLHNPGAGDKEHSIKELAEMIHSAGFECTSAPTKKSGDHDLEPEEIDFVVLAGGDGTVRKVAGELLEEHLPIGLLPMGTANNIAKTLGISGETDAIINSWKKENKKSYDVGKIYGLGETQFFLEGFGYGVFPILMDEMEKQRKNAIDDPEQKMKTALELLYDIVLSHEPTRCKIKIDGLDFSGSFLLVEVMNIRSIGPNLTLAPHADPGDGKFEVVLIAEKQRDLFAKYIHNKIHHVEEPAFFDSIKARNLEIYWEGTTFHIDDENVTLDHPAEVSIELQENALEFLIPA